MAGRPRTITPEKIVEAGMAVTLPELSFATLAAEMGVTVAAIYKYVDGIEALRLMVAEGIMARWPVPPLQGQTVEAYLLEFSAALRTLAHENPGIVGFLAQVSTIAPQTIRKIDAHHVAFAKAYGLSRVRATWLLSTVAEHAIAIADIVYIPGGRARRRTPENLMKLSGLEHLPKAAAERPPVTELEAFMMSMRALVVGALQLAEELP